MNMELREILNRVESLEDFTPKSEFVKVLCNYPELEEELRKQLSLDENQEWIKKAEKERFFFLIYDDSWKLPPRTFAIPNRIQLRFVGMKKLPTITIDIHQKPV